MFFIYIVDGPDESSLLSSLGPAQSVTTLLCVIIVVTVAMVLLTLMCVCSKKTASMKLQNNSAPLAENETRVSFKQLSQNDDIENQVTGSNKEETNGSVPIEIGVPAASTAQLSAVHHKEDTRPTSHPSPHLPPRNPHNSHSSAHPSNQLSTSAQTSSRASTPISVGRIHDDGVANHTTAAAASSATAAEGGKESKLVDNSWMPCRVQPDYEEVDLPEKPPSANTKLDDCDDTNIYQDIDLNQESKSQKPAAKTSDSIEPYAEYKEDSKKPSDILRPQRNSSSLQTSESGAPTAVKSSTETPRYAKVDKSRKSHEASSSNSSLANHLPEDGLTSQEVASGCNGGDARASAPATNIAELYTQVHKPKGNAVAASNEHDKDTHVPKSHESVNGESSNAANGDMVLNPCYGTTMLRNYPTGATPGLDSTRPAQLPTLEEPPYSTIGEERVAVTVNPDPGYSSIDEVQGAARTLQGGGGSGAAASATGANSLPKEPIYELVDAKAKDDEPSQNM